MTPEQQTEMCQQLLLVLSTEAEVGEWLVTPDGSLEWQTPSALASQPGGLQPGKSPLGWIRKGHAEINANLVENLVTGQPS